MSQFELNPTRLTQIISPEAVVGVEGADGALSAVAEGVGGGRLVGPLAKTARDVDRPDEFRHDGGRAGEGVDWRGEAVAVHGEILDPDRGIEGLLQLELLLVLESVQQSHFGSQFVF